VSQVLELVETGRCREALGLLEVFASHNPGEKTSGSAWLELARCFLGKGDRERAGKMALKASAFPDSAREAEAILADLDAPDI